MRNNWKTGMKMIRYAYGIKLNCIQAGVFALTGLFFLVTGGYGGVTNYGLTGGFFWICISILPTQLIHTLNVTALVQSSPMKKKMQTTVPAIVNLSSMAAVYLLETLLCGITVCTAPERAAEMSERLIVLAMMMVLVAVYVGICYKYFVAATICMVPAMVIWMRGGLAEWMHASGMFGGRNISFGLAVPVGFGILALGGLAEYLLTLALYKKPMSKMAQSLPLRKEL